MNGFRYLHQAYTATDPHYTGKVTVPTLWDTKTRRIVNNESPDIIRMLNSEFDAIAGDDADFYPKPLRAEIDRLNDLIYANVNNGVYRCGFAKSQAAYEQAYDALFATLDELEARLSEQRYLLGRQITEADWRLFPTLVRFDVAYFSLFRCNKKRIADYPNLSNLHARAVRPARHRRDRETALLRDQLLVDRAAQSARHHSKGNAGRLHATARSCPVRQLGPRRAARVSDAQPGGRSSTTRSQFALVTNARAAAISGRTGSAFSPSATAAA